MVTVNVELTIKEEDFARGWESNEGELAGSVRATLHELIGDDGGAYVPIVRVRRAVADRMTVDVAHRAALTVVGTERGHDISVLDDREVAAGVWVVFLKDADDGRMIAATVAPSRGQQDQVVVTYWDDSRTLHVKGLAPDRSVSRRERLLSAERNGDEIIRLT